MLKTLFHNGSYCFYSKRVALIKGDGIGSEISLSVQKIFEFAKIPIEWEEIDVSPTLQDGKLLISKQSIQRIKDLGIALKGPLATPIGKGHVSLNLTLRKALGLYANIRPCRTIINNITGYDGIDILIIRENTEGEYSGIEHEVINGVFQSIKLITREACERITKYALKLASTMQKTKIYIVHKATIMRASDGLFLKIAMEEGISYGKIEMQEISLDTICYELVKRPKKFQNSLLLMPNLYGDVVSDLCAGLIGGLGLTPSANIGDSGAIFEAVHGSAPDIAGKNIANPTALILSSTMMLDYIGHNKQADKIRKAVYSALQVNNTRTLDLGGTFSCSQYTDHICNILNK